MNTIKKYVFAFIKWVACSFELCTEGSSSRKLTMFAYTVFAFTMHYAVLKGNITDKWLYLGFLIIDSLTILLIMQILKASDINNFLSSTTSNTTKKETTKETTVEEITEEKTP